MRLCSQQLTIINIRLDVHISCSNLSRSIKTYNRKNKGKCCELQNCGLYRFAEGGGLAIGYTVKGEDEGYPRSPTTYLSFRMTN